MSRLAAVIHVFIFSFTVTGLTQTKIRERHILVFVFKLVDKRKGWKYFLDGLIKVTWNCATDVSRIHLLAWNDSSAEPTWLGGFVFFRGTPTQYQGTGRTMSFVQMNLFLTNQVPQTLSHIIPFNEKVRHCRMGHFLSACAKTLLSGGGRFYFSFALVTQCVIIHQM